MNLFVPQILHDKKVGDRHWRRVRRASGLFQTRTSVYESGVSKEYVFELS